MAAVRNSRRAAMAGFRCVPPHCAMLAATGAILGRTGVSSP
jgi:hypothetical protein